MFLLRKKNTSPWRESVLAHTRDIINARGNVRQVLELGCDDGFVSLTLSEEFPNVSFNGIDIREEKINEAVQNKKKRDIKNVNFSYDYFFDMKVEKKYDIVIFSEVYEHLIGENQIYSLRFIGNMLKNEGHIVFTVPNGNFIFGKLEKNKTFNSRYSETFFDNLKQTGHWLEPTFKEISKIFVSLGFDIQKHGYFNFPKRQYIGMKIIEVLFNKLPLIRGYLFKNQYIVAQVNKNSILLKEMNIR